MSFGDAIRSVLQSNYANFSGRARRSEYWFWTLALFLAYIVAVIVFAVVHVVGILLIVVVVLGVFVPSLAVLVRRLHDTGRSGWWYFIGLVPFVGGITLLVFTCLDSQPQPNQWGPSPKSAGPGSGYPGAPGYPGASSYPGPGYPGPGQ
jgi:uncharacterized membrane protein YhaH (DUF805 family)